ncbi:Uncharacterised protein [Mycobacteroides abscessus]|nr:Uncharacterised protein [Mycobacteroides abscessus]
MKNPIAPMTSRMSTSTGEKFSAYEPSAPNSRMPA